MLERLLELKEKRKKDVKTNVMGLEIEQKK